MNKITIQWLTDEYDCEETCGGSYAEGARVYLNNELLIQLIPKAHCYDPVSWTEKEVYEHIVEKLGYEVEESYV